MFRQWSWYVYIIECNDGTYYTGCTSDVLYRYEQHKAGIGSAYTAQRGVKRLVYFEEYQTLEEAWTREKQIKDWSQKKKRKLIDGKLRQSWDNKRRLGSRLRLST